MTKTIVATRGQIPNLSFISTGGTLLSQLSKTSHKSHATQGIENLQLTYGNWVLQNMSGVIQESDTGNDITIRAAIEYPSGHFWPIFFNGQRDVTLNSGGNITSDIAGLYIPANTQFWIRTQVRIATPASQTWPLGDACISGLGEGTVTQTTYSDLTTSGTITAGTGNAYGPLSIVGTTATSTHSFILMGDSITDGYPDISGDADGNRGYMARAVSNNIGYAKVARDTDAAQFVNCTDPLNYGRRFSIMKDFGTHIIVQLGTNDFLNFSDDARVYLQGIYDRLAAQGKIVIPVTIPPYTTSTDGWVTSGNQTVGSRESLRVSINTFIRTNPMGNGYIEVANLLETSQNSGKWVSPSGVAWTSDGIHPNVTAISAITSTIRSALPI